MAQIVLNRLGEISSGRYAKKFIKITPDSDEGFHLVIYVWADDSSHPVLSEWFPTFEAINYYFRDHDFEISWSPDR